MIVKELYRLADFTSAQWGKLFIARSRAIAGLVDSPDWYELNATTRYSVPKRLSESGNRLDRRRWTVDDAICARLDRGDENDR